MENNKLDVIDWLNDMANDDDWPSYYSDSEIRLLAKDALELLKAQETPDTNVGKWISARDKLPENEQMVIGYTPVDGYMFIGFHRTSFTFGYDASSWYIITAMRSTKKITKKVTHWMPLPEGPKEERG